MDNQTKIVLKNIKTLMDFDFKKKSDIRLAQYLFT